MIDKRKIIDEVLLVKELQEKQAKILGGVKMVNKDTIIFFLILFVLSLLVMEIYQIGASPGQKSPRFSVAES